VTSPNERLAAALADRYRIERELGQGGMATVYLAEDLKHDRKVALKVLKPELAAVLGADRFVIEIRTTASLQHPHILPLFDSGTADGFLYYVMPFIQGETLREKLNRETQLGVDEAVRIAIDVADALHYAHSQGVIHRDIKPENILLANGRPMVADFGIALAVSAAAGGRMTETGLSLGTPHYMSPEQATAEKEISARSDIYSLASVLYEMLAGQPPHSGGSAQQVIMKILTETPPPVTALRKSVPPNVSAAVDKAIEKLPADRFANAAAFAAALGDSSFRSTGVVAGRATTATDTWRQKAAVPALIATGLLVIALGWSMQQPDAPAPVTRYRLQLSEDQGLSGSPWSRLAVSPDGSKLVYMSDNDLGTHLLLRLRDQLDAVEIPGTDYAVNPAISPNGRQVAFMSRGAIKVASLAGGPPTPVTDSVVGLPGLAWGPDGFIYYDRLGLGPLMRVPEAGGRAESFGQVDSTKGEQQHSWPDVLPNGRGVIMTVSRGGPGAMGGATDEIAVLDLTTGTHRALVRGIFARYSRSGHLLYVTSDGTLMGVPFDERRMELTGEPVALTEGVGVRVGGGAVDLTLSANGTLWYAAGKVGSAGTRQPVWVERDGAATLVSPDWFGLIADPTISPDGKRLAVSTTELTSQIWVRDLEQGLLSRVSLTGQENVRPAWSADGRSVVYVSDRRTDRDLFQRLADGSQPETLLMDEKLPLEEVAFSSDGVWMIYRAGSILGERDLYARRIGSDSSIVLVATAASESSPALSPDGRWLAYVSTESGTEEVYVSPFPNTGERRWKISAQGGQEPVWSYSGNELFYRVAGTTNAQMVMDVSAGSTFVPGARRVLFPLTRYSMSATHQQYAVARDGRFLMIRATESNRLDHLVAVENFFEVLKARVPRR
jgi:serine/threonine-protein kinase